MYFRICISVVCSRRLSRRALAQLIDDADKKTCRREKMPNILKKYFVFLCVVENNRYICTEFQLKTLMNNNQ